MPVREGAGSGAGNGHIGPQPSGLATGRHARKAPPGSPGTMRADDGNRTRMTSLEGRSPAFGLTCGHDGAGQQWRVRVSVRCSLRDALACGTHVARAEAGQPLNQLRVPGATAAWARGRSEHRKAREGSGTSLDPSDTAELRLDRMVLSSGIPVDDFDPGIRPQDDLIRYANGGWLARTRIPADRARYNSFRILAEEAEQAVRMIVEEAVSAPEGSEDRKFGDLYASFMDAERADLLGWQPISALLAAARAVGSIPELLATLGQIEPLGIGSLFRLYVDTDPGNPERYVVVFQQGVLSLPDESYYREERFASVRSAFVAHVRRMLELAGQSEADKAAERIFALETAVAAFHWDRVASRDKEKTYNLYTWDEALAHGPDLSGWLAALAPPVGAFDEIVLRQPSYAAGLATLLTGEHLPAWRDWMCWQVIRGA